MRSAPFVALVALLALGAPAGAADQTVLGKSYVVKDPAPGVDPTLRTVVVLGKELLSDATLVGDPLANGATVDVIANGASPSSQLFALPPVASVAGGPGWKAVGDPVIGYTYKDAAGVYGPVKAAVVKRAANGTFLVKVTIKGALGPGPQPHVTVLPPTPGTDGGMRFGINGGDTYCVAFGGAAGGAVTNAPTKGTPNKVFKVASKLTAPTSEVGCPTAAVPTTTSTSTSTTTSTAPTTTVSFGVNVQPIFTAKCAVLGCHVGAFPAQGLNLAAGSAYASLDPGVKFSTECGAKLLVAPGSPSSSYLYQKVVGSGPGCFIGSQMPAIGAPLTVSELNTLSTWILVGAPNN